MPQQITITLPDRIYQALAREGEELEQSPAEYIKGVLLVAYRSRGGYLLKLEPVPQGLPPGEQELPLLMEQAPPGGT